MKRSRSLLTRLPVLAGAIVLPITLAADAAAQIRDPVREMQRRVEEERLRQRVEAFVEDTHEFFEISGELVSFRVHPNMTASEVTTLGERSRELEEQAGRLISFVRDMAPYVRGRTEGLWVIFDPPDQDSTLEERLTLILALVNRLIPKLEQFTALISREADSTVSVEDLQFEVSAPYFVVGGLEELRSLTRELRAAF